MWQSQLFRLWIVAFFLFIVFASVLALMNPNLFALITLLLLPAFLVAVSATAIRRSSGLVLLASLMLPLVPPAVVLYAERIREFVQYNPSEAVFLAVLLAPAVVTASTVLAYSHLRAVRREGRRGVAAAASLVLNLGLLGCSVYVLSGVQGPW